MREWVFIKVIGMFGRKKREEERQRKEEEERQLRLATEKAEAAQQRMLTDPYPDFNTFKDAMWLKFREELMARPHNIWTASNTIRMNIMNAYFDLVRNRIKELEAIVASHTQTR